jgi:hypothetical protein
MSEAFNFSVAGLLPRNTKQKSADPIGDDVNKITEEFAKLLISQISNQDPDKPPELNEVITQYSSMLATIGQIKANNAMIQFGQVEIGNSIIGKTVAFSRGTYTDPVTKQLVDDLGGGVVTGVDFSLDAPRVFIEGQTNPVAVEQIRSIYSENQMQSLQKGAAIIGKTVDYTKLAANPAYIDSATTPDQEPMTVQTFSGIVTAVDYSTEVPTTVISGETDPVPLTSIVKIQG